MANDPTAGTRLALLSVSDKSGLVDFAHRLTEQGYDLLSTGGTARALLEAGLAVTEVSDFTGFPEIMAGRVKTLHPRIHGGLLGRVGDDEAVMAHHDIRRIDIAVINLYPFEQVTAHPDCRFEDAIENIDIGGPAMVRSAAKNHASVGIVTSPGQYPEVLRELEQNAGALGDDFRYQLAVAAFNRIAQYDAAISNYLASRRVDGESTGLPQQYTVCFEKISDLRYGENPHQHAAWYRDCGSRPVGLAGAQQLQGKELSFNNIADADAAWAAVQGFDQPACVIVKHANPCGVALGSGPEHAYLRAFATDPTSAFGGVIAFNRELDASCAAAILQQQFVEVLLAPSISEAAAGVLRSKPNIRALQLPAAAAGSQWDYKRVGGGLLVQSADNHRLTQAACTVVSERHPGEQEWEDLLFAWSVVTCVKSNAIVYASKGQTLGIGAGQMSRVDSARIAAWKAQDAGLELQGSAMASDAFFPFRDGIDTAAQAGASCVIHPGGSMRDSEVIEAANEYGLAMVFTCIRHFRH